MICEICKDIEAKYKCPKCRIPYCSVTCCKTHKEMECSAPEPIVNNEISNVSSLSSYQYPTKDTVPVDILKLLENRKGLKVCLENPHLRNILLSLNECEEPAKLMTKAMQEPIFTEFVDECLKVIEPSQEKDDPLAELFSK